MHFDPRNPIIQLCIQAMAAEERGETDRAASIFIQAWTESVEALEKCICAYFLARHQISVEARRDWLATAVQHACAVSDVALRSTLPTLYAQLALAWEECRDFDAAESCRALALEAPARVCEEGPFYHGTKADLSIGDLLVAGRNSNYQSDLVMNHIYFTALPHGAGLAAALAAGTGRERVYVVEPTGSFENDPNVSDKKFPGNLTRSYRTEHPLRIVAEVQDWSRQSEEDIAQWRKRLRDSRGEIIN